MIGAELSGRRAVAGHPRIRRERIPTTVLDPDQQSSKGRRHSVRRCATRPWSYTATVSTVPLPCPERINSDSGQRICLRRLEPASIRNDALDHIAPQRNQKLACEGHGQDFPHASAELGRILPDAPGAPEGDSAFAGSGSEASIRACGGTPCIVHTGTGGGPEALAR